MTSPETAIAGLLPHDERVSYEAVLDPSEADVRLHRQQMFEWDNKPRETYSDEHLAAQLVERGTGLHWQLGDHYLDRTPWQQWNFHVNDEHTIAALNFAPNTPFTQIHAEFLAEVLGRFMRSFPFDLDKLRHVLTDDQLRDSFFEDKERFPLHGMNFPNQAAFALTPRGMGFHPYRKGQLKIPTFQAVSCHETVHAAKMDGDLGKVWAGLGYRWEHVPTTDIHIQQPDIAAKPEESVTDYARTKQHEDICETVVAYLYEPDLLQLISSVKFGVLKEHDMRDSTEPVEVRIEQVREPRMPDPVIVRYFIHETLHQEPDDAEEVAF